MAEEYDYHKMWADLGMDVEAHDGLLAAVGQMYGDAFLTQKNRPRSTSYLDGVAGALHSGRIRELVEGRAAGNPKKVVGTFCPGLAKTPLHIHRYGASQPPGHAHGHGQGSGHAH